MHSRCSTLQVKGALSFYFIFSLAFFSTHLFHVNVTTRFVTWYFANSFSLSVKHLFQIHTHANDLYFCTWIVTQKEGNILNCLQNTKRGLASNVIFQAHEVKGLHWRAETQWNEWVNCHYNWWWFRWNNSSCTSCHWKLLTRAKWMLVLCCICWAKHKKWRKGKNCAS